MTNNSFRSRLMKMSWEIQRKKQQPRSQSLAAAWTIYKNEDITVFYLVKRLHGNRPMQESKGREFGLFTQ